MYELFLKTEYEIIKHHLPWQNDIFLNANRVKNNVFKIKWISVLCFTKTADPNVILYTEKLKKLGQIVIIML